MHQKLVTRLTAPRAFVFSLLACAFTASGAFAAEVKSVKPVPGAPPESPAESAAVSEEPQQIDVQAMKKRYWTVGNEDLMDVVQNRLYTKKNRLELGVRYGFYSDDPFIDAKTLSVSLGYHINEWFSVHALWAKVSSKQSSAADTALRQANFRPVTNPAESLYGGEARASFLYGKLSLLGSSIIYYDFNVAAGAAMVKAPAGSVLAPYGGVGQQVYVSRTFCISVDYRLLYRSETVPGIGPRTVTTNWIQLGIGAFFP